MRLSMWVISDWLKEYKQDVYIKEGKRTIRSVRIFSDELKLSQTTLYLNQHDDDRILCMNEHDIIVVYSSELLEVFNRILDAFDYYNEASVELHDAIRDGAVLDDVLLWGTKLLNSFMILADPTFYVLGTCGDLGGFSMKDQIRQVFKEKLLPVESLLRINSDPKIRRSGVASYFVDMPEMECTAAVSNLFVYGEHKGWLIAIRPENNFTKGELDLQDSFAESMGEWIGRNDIYKEKLAKTELFIGLLSEKTQDVSLIEKRLEPFGWAADDPKYLYAVRSSIKGDTDRTVLLRLIESRLSDSFVFDYAGCIVILLNTRITDVKEAEEHLSGLVDATGFAAGRSPAFTSLKSLVKKYNAAVIALGDSSYPGKVSYFEDHVIHYLAASIKENSIVDPVHPAVRILEDYDRNHKQELSNTLKVFLVNAMNYTATAKELFIHRSSLIYRLEKIKEMTNIDLEDHRQRLWVELSYELMS